MSWFLLGLQLNRTTGIYISFFLFTIYALSRRWKSPGIKLLVAASCVMAALGTIQVAVTIAMAVAIVRSVRQVLCGQILDQPEFPLQLAAIQDIAAVINVWVNPDLPWSKFLETAAANRWPDPKFQFYRCYVIWGSQKKVLVLPGALILSTTVMAILGMRGFVDLRIGFGLTVATNLALTCLIASIFGLGKTLRERYNRAMGLILESGAIYCIGAIAMIVTFNDPTGREFIIAAGVAAQLMNVIPTFTLAYIGLNNAGVSGATHSTSGTSSNLDASIFV
ncbi:hypothetical protein B0H13DRAFT_1879667 [Mycena leptocephala]|nr:hypothetical protein B0H13DRAFT_1879667 [Mycena leptocephala]